MEDQVPSLKKKNLKHRDYANKPIQELFSAEIIKTCQIKQFNYCASIIAINEGEGKFSIQKMPAMLQLSSVNAVQITDLDNNGQPDLVLGGNEYGLLPQFERLDAGRGAVMMNLGAGNFRLLDAQESGVEVNGQVRDIIEIKTATGKQLLFLRNNMNPVLFKQAVSINATTVLPKTKK